MTLQWNSNDQLESILIQGRIFAVRDGIAEIDDENGDSEFLRLRLGETADVVLAMDDGSNYCGRGVVVMGSSGWELRVVAGVHGTAFVLELTVPFQKTEKGTTKR